MKSTYKIILCLSFFMFIMACDDKKKQEVQDNNPPPKQSENPTTYQKAERTELTSTTVKEFIQWSSGSDLKEREEVRREITKASKDEEVLKLLFEEFERVYIEDVGYSLIVLSIIGELKNPAALPQLEKIIYKELPEQEEKFHSGLTKRDFVEMLSSKAVECAAYLKTKASNRSVLNAVAQHPSNAVRSSAIDAYLFNNDDSEEAKKALREVVQENELHLIDRVRFLRNSNEEEFDRNLSLYYKAHPDQVAPEPGPPTEESREKDSIKVVRPIQPPKRKQ